MDKFVEKRKKSSSNRQEKIAFIACSKTKKKAPCKAKEMYQGALFKKALAYAICTYDDVYILSAKYGVLSLDQIISPYDKTLSKMPKKEKEQWYAKVEKQLQLLKKRNFVFLTGKLYNDPFLGEKPLAGLTLGNQLKWFNNKLKTQHPKFF